MCIECTFFAPTVAVKVISSAHLQTLDREQVASLPLLLTGTQQVYCPARLLVKGAAETLWYFLSSTYYNFLYTEINRGQKQVYCVY